MNKVVWLAINAQYTHTSLAVRYLREISKAYYNTEILELTINNYIPDLLGYIYEARPTILGIACYIWNIEIVKTLLPLLKKVLPDTIIICGGPEVSYNTEKFMLAYPMVDYVVQGEGESSVRYLLEYFQHKRTALPAKEISWRESDGELHIGMATDVANVEGIPFPYQEEELDGIKDRILYYETSRGCPFSCAYCLSCATTGVRFLGIERVVQELTLLVAHDVKQVKFVDRTFNAKKSHFFPILQFIKSLPNTCRTNFHFEVAADYFDADTLDFLSLLPPGRVQLEVGIQSTNEHTLQAVSRVNHWDRITQNIQHIIAGGNIHVHTDLIIGLPHEDMESFHHSFNEVYKLHSNQLQLGFLKFLSGASMMRLVETGGYLYENQAPYEVLSNQWMTYEEIHWLHVFEDVFERYHNAGRCVRTISFLIDYCEAEDAFLFYKKFTDWWKAHGYHHRPHAEVRLYEMIFEFIKTTYNEDTVLTADALLRLDLLESGRAHSWPACLNWSQEAYKKQIGDFWRTGKVKEYLEEFSFTNWHDIRSKYHIEVFERDPLNIEINNNNAVCILFDYCNNKVRRYIVTL